MAASPQNKIYNMLQEKIEKLQDKIDFLKDRLIDLKRKRDHLCLIRDEDDEGMQIKMLNEYKKVEGNDTKRNAD